MPEISFTLNGTAHVARDIDPHVTLLHYLRQLDLTGCKEGCAEGECGACAVALVARGPGGETRYEAVNACLVLLPTMHGREVVTVEGIARGETLHPVQRCMADGGGSQCGYCTPGFVVSLFAEYYRADAGPLDEESIAGNLCRCTGYRPIRDAAHALIPIRTREVAERIDDPHRKRLSEPTPPLITTTAGETRGQRFVRANSLSHACEVRRSSPELVVLGGGTDLVVEVNQRHRRHPGFLSLEGVPELNVFEERDDAITVGAAVSLAHIEERLHGRIRLFDELLPLFSSRLIRSRATLGGNLGTASPIGDSPPALLALDAEVIVANVDGTRTVPIDRFFLDYRKTALAADELIVAVRLPKPFPRLQRFYKVSKRRADDISTVAAGFALDVDGRGVVTKARLAFGGVAATPKRALSAEAALVGQAATAAQFAAAARIAAGEFTPMDDHRGSARYRSAMVRSLVERLYLDALATRDASTGAGS